MNDTTVSDFTSLQSAIEAVDTTTTAGSYTITIEGTITETTDLFALNLQSGVDVVIQGSGGGGGALDGAGIYEGLSVYQGNVTVEALTIEDAVAQGGAGSGGGGGGAGLGGGLFVAGLNVVDGTTVTTGGAVTLNDVTFSSDSAIGGSGGAAQYGGGGGGLGGSGASQGGGGGVGNTAYGGTIGSNGGGGIVLGATSGGGNSGLGRVGGPDGGGGGGRAGGGVGGSDGTSGAGGFGGGGAAGGGDANGGTGGFGGGGGGGGIAGGPNPARGGVGGFGGGGGGGGYNFGGASAGGGGGGAGGFGGGQGDAGGGQKSGTGGGGLGAGGDIFVQQGGSLTIEGGVLNAGTVTGGSGGNAQSGSAFGDGIFLQGDQTETLEAAGSGTLTVAGVIADQTGSGGTGTLAGAGTISIAGSGTVALDAANTYTGGTTIESGTLLLGAMGAAGSGAITFGSGDPPSLAFTVADAPTNTIDGFGAGDTIDITDLAYSNTGTALWSDGTLTVTEDSTTLTLAIAGSYSEHEFTLASDGAGGTTVTICYYPGTGIRTPSGDVAVEALAVGDRVVIADGRALPVRWIGRNTVSTRFADPLRVLPIRIRAGALAEGLPERDLLVSPEHALFLDDILIQAGALVNGLSIIRERHVPETFTYYHVELEEHALILAEGTPAESFVDNVHRMAFENWAEHESLYGNAPIVEMSYPRAQSHRQVPIHIRDCLMERARSLFGDAVQRVA